MATLIKVEQRYNGHHVNTVYGDSIYHVKSRGEEWYRLELGGELVTTFMIGTTHEHQCSMCKEAADYTDGLTTVQYWCWNMVKKEI